MSCLISRVAHVSSSSLAAASATGSLWVNIKITIQLAFFSIANNIVHWTLFFFFDAQYLASIYIYLFILQSHVEEKKKHILFNTGTWNNNSMKQRRKGEGVGCLPFKSELLPRYK